MIPIKDRNPTHRVPVVNISIIVVNIAVFLYEVSLGPQLESFFYQYGMVPASLTASLSTFDFNFFTFLPLFSSMFLHGGWLHLGGNMLYLWVFGDNVEDKLGHGRYFLFYI
ncbi:MAG: rhomboid family intramembrane serine protease, partial [Bacteroidota bacterium]